MLCSDVSKVPRMAAQVMAGCSSGMSVWKEEGLGHHACLQLVTRVSDQVHLACVELSNDNRPLVSEGSMMSPTDTLSITMGLGDGPPQACCVCMQWFVV